MTLPLGVFRRPGEAPRVGARAGDRVLDLVAVADDLGVPEGVVARPSLNALMALGRETWRAVGEGVAALAGEAEQALVPLPGVELLLPIEVADYVDFYSSLQHATNLGRLFRPDADPLLPN